MPCHFNAADRWTFPVVACHDRRRHGGRDEIQRQAGGHLCDAGQIEARAKLRPIQRVQTADNVVGAVIFLASDDAAFITGQTVNVDGGVTMR
jgi:NAD(P)-dependent dehydrogenase (short-subunit alcohol dehydrogenase family)